MLVPLGIVRVSVVVLVYEQTLDPGMAYAAGVARQIHPLGIRRRAAQTAAKKVKRPLCELRRLVYEYPVILQTVIFMLALVALPVSELDAAPVLKRHQVA